MPSPAVAVFRERLEIAAGIGFEWNRESSGITLQAFMYKTRAEGKYLVNGTE